MESILSLLGGNFVTRKQETYQNRKYSFGGILLMTDDGFTTNTEEWYYPSEETVKNAIVPDYEATYAEAMKDIEAFWAKRAETLEWQQPWSKVLDDSNAPFYKWFVDAKTNIIHNALDRHVKTAKRNKQAIIWEGEPGDKRTFSYWELNQEVCKFANVLKSKGVKKGDTVTIYMGRVPEIVIAMLACAKLGAPHSVVYGGFSEQALADRIEDAQSNILITCDGSWLRSKIVPLKGTTDKAIERAPIVETVIVVKRTNAEVNMKEGRDFWYHDLMTDDVPTTCETEVMDAEDMLFILYTSGTTGKPKGVVHTHGGYQVYTSTTLEYVFDLKEEDRWWCAADPGWITGHSYIVYSPLILGMTSIIYEGGPNYPNPDRWWSIVENYGVSVLYTAPTAIRGLMRFGDEWPLKHDLSSLRLLGSVGEPINPEAWKWYYEMIGNKKCPIMDTWWQTETGGFMITPVPSLPLKPGSATRPFPGIDVDVVDDEGNSCAANEDGKLIIKQPWPGMLRTVLGDDQRYLDQYWSDYKKQGWYTAGDSARKDDDGYIWVIGRIDDVLKVSGYRLGTAEVESGLVSHSLVAEAAVIGIPDALRGNAIYAYCILIEGIEGSEELEKELKVHVRHEVGPIAVPSGIEFVDKLPKTRSGKIMRRVLKARAQGLDEGDVSTLED